MNKTDVVTIARNYLRDYPKFFSTAFVPQGRTYDLAKPNVDASSLYVATVTGASAAVPTSSYQLDERNGILRMPDLSVDTILVEGYYYEWLLPADLSFYADMAINLNTHNISVPLEQMAPAVVDVVGMHTVVEALWGLLGEFSRDIDVITSESVHIIASQRYRMVSSLLDYWMEEYRKRANALNIGLERLEVLTLRRVSKTTNRLVPIYKPREIGDSGPIERIFPPIDDGLIHIEEKDEELRSDVFIDGEPPPAFVAGTWSGFV